MSKEPHYQSGNERSGNPELRVPKVDFIVLANNVLDSGLFDMLPDSELLPHGRFKVYPERKLDTLYRNGPIQLMNEIDVPETSMNAVRVNFKEANHVLLPLDQLSLYFHHALVDGSIFRSELLEQTFGKYSAPNVELISTELRHKKDTGISFQTGSRERKTTDRKLFTRDEMLETLLFLQKHPESVLAIMVYQSVILEFLYALQQHILFVAKDRGMPLTEIQKDELSNYITLWGSSNFSDNLVPAIAIFFKQKKDRRRWYQKLGLFKVASQNPDLDQTVFSKAAQFIIDNGAFRQWVTVPATVSLEGEERVNHFLCPAVGTIREQILDGSLLYRVYLIVQKRKEDPKLFDYLEGIVIAASKRFSEKDFDKKAFEDMVEKRTKITFMFENREVSVHLTEKNLQLLEGNIEEGDMVIELLAGSMLYTSVKEAIEVVLQTNQTVAFNFNTTTYRITPSKIVELLKSS